MGYDCTFHLIDPKRIQEILVPRILGRSEAKTAFDKRRDAGAIISAAQAHLHGQDPAAAAHALSWLATLWSAAELPYSASRNLAFSIWDLVEKSATVPGDLDPMPAHLFGNPESLFAEVVERHPVLQGNFPTAFVSNHSAGVFFTSGEAAEAHAWLLTQIDRMVESPDTGKFRQLAQVLGTAAERGYCFWEATDLPVDPPGRVDWSLYWAEGCDPDVAVPSTPVASPRKLNYIRDEDVVAGTGRSWATWFDRTQRIDGASDLTPFDLSRQIHRRHPPLSLNWSLAIATGFSRSLGKWKRKPTSGAAKMRKISRTIARPCDKVLLDIVESKRRSQWIGVGGKVSVLETKKSDVYALQFPDKTEAHIRIRPKGNKTSVSVEHHKLFSPGPRALFWESRLNALAALAPT